MALRALNSVGKAVDPYLFFGGSGSNVTNSVKNFLMKSLPSWKKNALYSEKNVKLVQNWFKNMNKLQKKVALHFLLLFLNFSLLDLDSGGKLNADSDPQSWLWDISCGLSSAHATCCRAPPTTRPRWLSTRGLEGRSRLGPLPPPPLPTRRLRPPCSWEDHRRAGEQTGPGRPMVGDGRNFYGKTN